MTREQATLNLVQIIYTFFRTRPLSRIRQTDIWRIIKSKWPDDPTVAYWRQVEAERHGSAPSFAEALNDDDRFRKIAEGPREVYYELSRFGMNGLGER